jgi:hypothetical protein
LALPDPLVRPRGAVVSPRRPAAAVTAHSPAELLWSEVNPRPYPAATRLPDDEVPDERIPSDLALRRANERYPVNSAISGATGTAPGSLREAFTQSAQRQFRSTLNSIEPGIVARLDQPFGKDNLSQCFYSTPGLRHVLLPLWKSGFLYEDPLSWGSFCDAYFPAAILRDLLLEYGDVPFAGIRGFPEGWESETDVNQERVAMATAALLHFNGSVADLVRWIGGPHVGAHRDHLTILKSLETAGVDPSVVSDLRRIFLSGIPGSCRAVSGEENFTAYYRYGNHSTVEDDPHKAYQALVKDNRKGFTLLFDYRAVLLMLHCHLTPQGLVDLNTPYKNPRPIFDSSFRPYPWCFAINDWTHKDNEPPLTFAGAELGFMVWLYNLRITYPLLEIYIADDDVSGAFRLMRYHPNCMAMHTFIQGAYGVVNTGGTFGDNTSPSNFDPIGMARRQLAWYLWEHDPDVDQRVLPHLPALQLAPEPTLREVSLFRPADKDTINSGVLDQAGKRLAPPYNMHVDDALYADVGTYLVHTICASVGALFGVLGMPTNPLVPSPLSSEKFEGSYNHERKLVGRHFNSRRLTVGMLPYKRERLLELLLHWTSATTYDLLEISQLLGVLENHMKYARWARCWYFALQNHVRRALFARYQILKRVYKRREQELRFSRQLPASLLHRIDSLVARGQAQLLWSTRQRFSVDSPMLEAIRNLLAYVEDNESPWEVPLGMIVPREPHFWSRGDASLEGGGAYCPGLSFWFDVAWSPKVLHGTRNVKPASPDYVHINALEFIVIILQLAAIRTRLDTMSPKEALTHFPNGRPDIPVWLGETDNTVSASWENRATARSSQGQGLVSVYAELLKTSFVHTQCKHLAGVLNTVADDISRNNFCLPPSERCSQLFRKHPLLASLDYFQPSPELLRLLTLRLFSRCSQAPCALPTALGQFVPAGCTTFGSVII